MGMRITKFGHACVRIEHQGQVVVLDPGVFTEPEAVAGATAVLVTHVHPDHLHPDNLRATDAPVFTVARSPTSSRPMRRTSRNAPPRWRRERRSTWACRSGRSGSCTT